jgi:glycosyltransferase involved in cell wall biosynthesis
MRFLILEQDLRVSGTSQGIISRSFLSKLRMAYPQAIIDVVYLKSSPSDDQLNLLPVDSIVSHVLNLKVPFFTKLIDKVYWRLFHVSLQDKYIHKVYASYIKKVAYENYDHIFIRSAGISHETILACKDLPILKKAIVNFHDPYPLFWYVGSKTGISNLELFQMKDMFEIVKQAKTCSSSAHRMSEDLAFLYGTRKKFFTLPHHYSEQVFDLSETSAALKKNKKVTIAYHGAIQFGRNVDILLDAYKELVDSNDLYKENTEFVLRLKGLDLTKLATKYKDTPNIVVLQTLNFSNSCFEQQHIADINVILENGPLYCNILVGKAPFLAAIQKPIFCISPERSELRAIIKEDRFIANMNDKAEIKYKLEDLIQLRLTSNEPVSPFGDFFSDENFTKSLNEILAN